MYNDGFQFGVNAFFGILYAIFSIFIIGALILAVLWIIWNSLKILYEFFKYVFLAIKWNRFFAKNPTIKAEIIAATDVVKHKSKSNQSWLIDRRIAVETGYPVEWVQVVTRDLRKKEFEKMRVKQRMAALEEKRRLNTLVKSWWQFWR